METLQNIDIRVVENGWIIQLNLVEKTDKDDDIQGEYYSQQEFIANTLEEVITVLKEKVTDPFSQEQVFDIPSKVGDSTRIEPTPR